MTEFSTEYDPLDEAAPDESEQALQDIAIQSIMSTEQGRKLFQGILDQCNHDADCFNADSRVHAYQEGKRSVAIIVADMLRSATPDLYLKMIGEKLNG